jgi:NAD(P)-dependent dehydrogenase (short-subunit alcohol dehydrogenase family)
MPDPDPRMFEGFSVDLTGKVACVLGCSAEGGTGWAIAEALAKNGAKVVVGSRSKPALDRLAAKIGGTAFRCDAGEEDDVKAMAQCALDTYGRLDIAVNSAGQPVINLIADLTKAEFESAIRVNLLGNFYFVKYMAEAIGENGSIVFISSISATHPVLPHGAYAAAKAGSDCLIRYAALEFAPRNIRVNSILPGAIKSDLAREAFADPAFEASQVYEIPLGRVGYPEDFANAVLFLAGPSYMTGVNWQYNGGNQLTRMAYLSEMAGGREAYGSGKVLGDR